jgi:hypothetical protein
LFAGNVARSICGQLDRSEVLEVVSENGMRLRALSPELQNDEEVCVEALSSNNIAWHWVSKDLKNKAAVVLAAMRSRAKSIDDDKILRTAGALVRDTKEVVLEAVRIIILERIRISEQNSKIILERISMCSDFQSVNYSLRSIFSSTIRACEAIGAQTRVYVPQCAQVSAPTISNLFRYDRVS